VRRFSSPGGCRSSEARKAMDSATIASTGGAGTTISPRLAAPSDRLCATVKAVTAPRSVRQSRMRRRSIRTKRRWSIPFRIWSTPSEK
jgi:hypothetical protein